MSIFNRTIGARLNSGFFIVLVILMVLAVISYTSQRDTIRSIKIDIAAGQDRLGMAQRLRESTLRSGSYIRDVGLNTDVAPMNVAIKSFESESKYYDELFAQLSRQVWDVEGKQLLAQINDARLMAMPHAKEAIGLATIFNTDMAVKLLTDKLAPAQVKWLAAIESFVKREEIIYKDAVASSITRGERANAAVFGVAMLAVVIALIVAWWLRRSITVPLIHAVKLARAVATKDLTVQVDFQSDDEAGQLLDAMRAMNSDLVYVVTQVREATIEVAQASREIATGGMDLSSRTESQSVAMEKATATISRLSEAVQANAVSASSANNLASNAMGVARNAGEKVSSVVSTMGQIHSGARRISDIVQLIDTIAFQTNILALNAAVEASRAGEQGRGFAVVATEVRALAQGSAHAAKEIRTLITESSEQVDRGVVFVEAAGQTMQQVVEAVGEVLVQVNEISVACGNLANEIQSVTHTIQEIDQNTLQNAALVEQAAASTQSLNMQADMLAAAVETFKL